MLFPAPSLSAEVEEVKNAYSFKLPTLGLSTRVVVAVIEVLPGLLALPATRLKLTALPESVSVIESVRTALSAIGLAPEFRTWAWTGAANIAATRTSPASAPSFAGIRIESLVLDTVNRDGGRAGAEAPRPRRLSIPSEEITEWPVPECSASRCR